MLVNVILLQKCSTCAVVFIKGVFDLSLIAHLNSTNLKPQKVRGHGEGHCWELHLVVYWWLLVTFAFFTRQLL